MRVFAPDATLRAALGDPGPVTVSDRRLHATASAMLAANPPYNVARATRRVVMLIALILRSSCVAGSVSIGAKSVGATDRRCAIVIINSP